jgi:iron complex outermembrane receptor protein
MAAEQKPEIPMRNEKGALLLRFHKISLATATLLLAAASQNAFAQSTGSEAVEENMSEVVVSATRVRAIGIAGDQTAPKSRITLTSEYLESQSAGQSFFQGLNQVPGVNFTNNDPYGSSGGNLRIRGFDGSRVSVTFDGIPLNDSGNYALFTNQMPDSEIIDRIDVNLGTTDVDSPTASATGGTVAIRTRKPTDEAGGQAVLSFGENNYRRAFARFDTGEWGSLGTKAFIAMSYANYDKFKGFGELEKKQVNGAVRQDFENGNFVQLAFHYNRNRNAQYRNTTDANFKAFGRDYDNIDVCTRDLPTAGVADNDNASPVASTPSLPATDNPLNTSSCTNYYGVRINPSDTGNVRSSSLFNFTDNLRMTFDASWQYTLANGGGSTVISETPSSTSPDKRVLGNSTALGWDLNDDGDLLDSLRFYTPNTTNTKRWGANASLIWDITEDQRVRVAYTYDRARHRQTGQWGYILDSGVQDVFAGRQGQRLYAADGDIIRGRDRFSIAELSQLSAEWRGQFADDKFTATVGVRAPFFTRELNQYCYTPNGGNGNSGTIGAGGGVLCTSRAPLSVLPNGNVTFAPAAPMGTAVEFIRPYSEEVKFDDILPNLGLTFRPTDSQTLYFSYAEGLSAPRTDNLYAVRLQTDGSIGRPLPESETTKSYDIGWRVNHARTIASVALYRIDYTNRIVQSFDPELGFSVDRNVGDVKIQGFDAQLGQRFGEKVDFTLNASYNDSELLDDLPTGLTTSDQPLAGKVLVETPKWTFGARTDIDITENLHAGLQAKKVDKRFTSDVNDTSVDAYTVVDFDIRYEFKIGGDRNVQLQFNVNNLLDEEYYGNISPVVSGLQGVPLLGRDGNPTGVTGLAPFLGIGSPRTAMATIRVNF